MTFLFKILYIIYSINSFFNRKVFIKKINSADLVLDVGSGDKPLWRADVIVDKYLDDDQQRHSGAMVYDKRKIFIEADVENLPFKDKVFDFVFCAHLLEHVENPDKAIKELTRVAKRGYIEVPYAIVDLLKPFPPHLWFCDYKDDILFFKQKEKTRNFFLEHTEKFGKVIFNNAYFQYLLAKYIDAVFIRLYWEKTVRYKVIRSEGIPYIYTYQPEIQHDKGISSKFTFLIYKISYVVMSVLFYKTKKIEIEKLLKK